MLQYAGGLLAASRTPDGKEERGAYYVNMLGGMTSMQVRLHHAIYSALKESNVDVSLAVDSGNSSTRIWLPLASLVSVLAAETISEQLIADQLPDAVIALQRDGLIASHYAMGDAEFFQEEFENSGIAEHMLAVIPTQVGVLLFLWAHGLTTSAIDEFFDLDLHDFDPPRPSVEGAQVGATYDPTK